MDAPDVRRAAEAAQVTAAELGLQAQHDAVVISNSDRIVLRLMPCDAVVRAAPTAHHADSALEVEVARRLAGAGGPVAELDPRVSGHLYRRDGFDLSFWTYYEPAGPEITPAGYAAVLMRLHEALRRTGLRVPHVTERIAVAQADIGDRARTPALPGPDRELLSTTLSRLRSSVSRGSAGEQPLHGEPHPGNLLRTRKGPLFVDLGACCRGPAEFDIAHAPEESAEHYPGADRDLVGRCRILMWALVSTWRWRHDDQFPGRDYWRTEGLSQLRAALGRHELPGPQG